jgi:hypothetical protein
VYYCTLNSRVGEESWKGTAKSEVVSDDNPYKI